MGENTGATSYHLRELAKHRMIEVAQGMGRGKEKYWRVVPGGFSYGEKDRESAEALEILLDDLVRQRGTRSWRCWSATAPCPTGAPPTRPPGVWWSTSTSCRWGCGGRAKTGELARAPPRTSG